MRFFIITTAALVICTLHTSRVLAEPGPFFYTWSGASPVSGSWPFPTNPHIEAVATPSGWDITVAMELISGQSTPAVTLGTLGIRPSSPNVQIHSPSVASFGGIYTLTGTTRNYHSYCGVGITGVEGNNYISRVGNISSPTGSRPIVVNCIGVGQIGDGPLGTQRAVIRAAQIGTISTTQDLIHVGFSGDVFADFIAEGSASANLSCGWVDNGQFGGDFFGSIKVAGFVRTDIVEHLGIAPLFASGDFGSATTPVTVVGQVVRQLTASNIYANINTLYYTAGSTQISYDSYNRVSSIVTNGDFVGSVSTNSLAPDTFSGGVVQRFNVTGNLDADIAILNSLDSQCGTDPASVVVGGSIVAGRTITIGGTLHSGNSTSGEGGLSLATNGLQGQVIVNATGTDGQWDGPVTIGTSPLTQSVTGVYDASSSTVGGGAVGLVPYHLYASDCSPPQDPSGG